MDDRAETGGRQRRAHTYDEDGVERADAACRADGGLRLLPWLSESGKPCYLRAEEGEPGVVGLFADRVEARQLGEAERVLGEARAVLGEPAAGALALRLSLTSAAGALERVLRIAESRGRRVVR